MIATRCNILCIFFLTTIMTGCASVNSIKTWRESIENYVENSGHGNLNVIRNLSNNPTSKRFDCIGKESGGFNPNRTDTLGVLVGHEKINNRYWFIFLLGVIDYQGGFVDVTFDNSTVRDIRCIAVSKHDNRFQWVIGDHNKSQLATYLAPQEIEWQNSHPSRTDVQLPNSYFPTKKDQFRLSINDQTLLVRDDRSGASWRVDLSISRSETRSMTSATVD